MYRHHIAFLLCFPLCFSGCRPDHGTAPVTITVLKDGEPISGATVCLIPTDGTGRGASASCNASGTAKPKTGQGFPGAWPGEYQVTVTLLKMMDGKTPQADGKLINLLPPKYAEPETSGLTLSVDPRKGADVIFDLK